MVMRMRAITVVLLGNYHVPYTTENHVAASIESLGHTVVRLQEGETPARDVAKLTAEAGADVFMWIQTLGLAESGGTLDERLAMVDELRGRGIPAVGFHLDRWWDLAREDSVAREPFFQCLDVVYTADGGNQDRFAAAGVNHRWSPPGVWHEECVIGTRRHEYESPIAFVGNWRGGYHREWQHRFDLVRHLGRKHGERCAMWPRRQAIRGSDLADLYASVDVIVGDSCMVGSGGHYWSDRVPETLGRGGFLLHPWTPGIEDHFTDGEHLRLWPLGNWRELDRLIGYYLAHPDERRKIAEAGRAHVLANHTYRVRMDAILQEVLG